MSWPLRAPKGRYSIRGGAGLDSAVILSQSLRPGPEPQSPETLTSPSGDDSFSGSLQVDETDQPPPSGPLPPPIQAAEGLECYPVSLGWSPASSQPEL